MAKPIIQNPIIRGKAAKEFSRLLLSGAAVTKEKTERNRKDVEIYRYAIKNK